MRPLLFVSEVADGIVGRLEREVGGRGEAPWVGVVVGVNWMWRLEGEAELPGCRRW